MLHYNSRMDVGLYEPNGLAANLVLVIPLALSIAAAQATPMRRRLCTCRDLLVAGKVFVHHRLGAGAALAW